MSLGLLGFLNPWLLLALGALPALWWLLRTVPPQPRTIAFPPTRMLKDLENRKQTPARTLKEFIDQAKAKPQGAKGTYIQRVAVSSTMGPGVKVDPVTVASSGN